ncbi:hypothetical protein BV898_03080 [Hypsibius exemplaris]|uniref:Uncharacterized protein n=1 Tax=Hypsibius exemplaris TaxID=2072580 RepID=A0A1W0X706_HYPEX|nr:hypothetical protein BV898_03080 [Hypsibius exemplaris]
MPVPTRPTEVLLDINPRPVINPTAYQSPPSYYQHHPGISLLLAIRSHKSYQAHQKPLISTQLSGATQLLTASRMIGGYRK